MTLTRRNVLSGAAAIAAASVLRPRPATAQTAPAAGSTGCIVGATVSAAAFGTSTMSEAVTVFDSNIGAPMASVAGRLYFGSDLSHGGEGMGPVRQYATSGRVAVCSFRPDPAMTQAGYTALASSVTQLLQAGLVIDSVTFWHEPNYLRKSPFQTAAAYQSFFRYYAPAVSSQGVDLCYIPLVLRTYGPLQWSYMPLDTSGAPLVQAVYGDYYCRAQYADGVRLDTPVAIASKYGLRLGLAEFGRTDGPTPGPDAEFAAYCSYITDTLLAAPSRGVCLYFAGGSGGLNVPDQAGYQALAGLRAALSG